jgi:hypothetical protein
MDSSTRACLTQTTTGSKQSNIINNKKNVREDAEKSTRIVEEIVEVSSREACKRIVRGSVDGDVGAM